MFVPVYEPYLKGNEKRYVNDCLDTNWISSRGKYVNLFEQRFAEYTGAAHAVAVSNGTVAIHLALAALGIGPGDEVLVPTLTYIASVNPIAYLGATPVFVDSSVDNWQLDLDDLEKKITEKTRAVVAVHLYGNVCDMDRLVAICRKHHLLLVEDCAEALGTTWKGRHVGTFGDVGCFSFFGNKTVTTGEGGMVVATEDELAKHLSCLKGQGVSPVRYYWHEVIGFNFRMTNIQAAIGLAQLEQVDEIMSRKRRIAERYKSEFERRGLPLKVLWEKEHSYNCMWLPTICLNDPGRRDSLMADLKEKHEVETRPAFYPVHTMPMYVKYAEGKEFPGAETLSYGGMNLPGFPGMTDEQQEWVINAISQELA